MANNTQTETVKKFITLLSELGHLLSFRALNQTRTSCICCGFSSERKHIERQAYLSLDNYFHLNRQSVNLIDADLGMIYEEAEKVFPTLSSEEKKGIVDSLLFR